MVVDNMVSLLHPHSSYRYSVYRWGGLIHEFYTADNMAQDDRLKYHKKDE